MAQGAYYAATGVWALADIESFQVVTGPKADQWLVKTVGVLVTAIGGALALAGWRRRVTPEIRLLAVSSGARAGGDRHLLCCEGGEFADLPGRRRRGAGGGRRVGCLGAGRHEGSSMGQFGAERSDVQLVGDPTGNRYRIIGDAAWFGTWM